MTGLVICGDCSKKFETSECPYCKNEELVNEVQLLRNQLAREQEECKRLQAKINDAIGKVLVIEKKMQEMIEK